MPTKAIKCVCCQGGKRPLRTPEGKAVQCPYCTGSGVRRIEIPHRSHQMSKWRTEIRCPGNTERFYGVRHCTKCGTEELKHPAGHFLNGLESKCTGEGK